MLKHGMFSWGNFAYLYPMLALSLGIISFKVLALWRVSVMLLACVVKANLKWKDRKVGLCVS
jgi:hypothetical protein